MKLSQSKTVFITNIPAPYREQIHEIVSAQLGGNYKVVYCNKIEPNRQWEFTYGRYQKEILKCFSVNYKGRTIYLWSDVRSNIRDASVVIISGFSLPVLVAFFVAVLKKKSIIAFSDATRDSENKISCFHRFVRKIIYSRCSAYLGASQKTLDLFRSYGARDEELFQSHLCANNEIFEKFEVRLEDREYDILLCGQMIKIKMYDFSLSVIALIKKTNPYLKVKVVGDGPERDMVLERLNLMNVDFTYAGFVQQDKLPKHYATAKILFFPSEGDAWGVVANEACAAGTPVITNDKAGAAGELVIHDQNGYVLPLKEEVWCKYANILLNDEKIWEQMSGRCRQVVSNYNYSNAARGICDAVKHVSSTSDV